MRTLVLLENGAMLQTPHTPTTGYLKLKQYVVSKQASLRLYECNRNLGAGQASRQTRKDYGSEVQLWDTCYTGSILRRNAWCGQAFKREGRQDALVIGLIRHSVKPAKLCVQGGESNQQRT